MRKQAKFEQLSLLGPSLHVDSAVKAAMNKALRGSRMSREQLVDAMNELAETEGIRLSGGNAKRLQLSTLEKWLAPFDREHIPSLKALAIFCKALGASEPMQALVAPLGLRLIDERQAKLLERAEIEEEIRTLKRRKQRIEADL